MRATALLVLSLVVGGGCRLRANGPDAAVERDSEAGAGAGAGAGTGAETGTDAEVEAGADGGLGDADVPWDPDGAALGDGTGDTDGGAECPHDMVALVAFCIDRYESPNVDGASPLAFQTAFDGETWCATRGKRLCTEAEWVVACSGASGRAYPYGSTYERGRCNDDKTWRSPNWGVLGTWPSDAAIAEAARLYQADPSGARAGCESEDGVMDLTGNVAEWVTRSFPNANNYDHVLKGCYWAGCYGGSPPSCTFVNPAHPGGFRTYEAGFRCCRDR